MKVHEYQARQLLEDVGVPVPVSEVVETVEAAVAAHRKIGGTVVVKAQVFAGGRGKAGFVKLCKSPVETEAAARSMLSNRMVSKQTGPEGIEVRKLLVADGVDIESEYYVGVVLDRARRTPVMMVSREGGVEIEEVAARNPDAIVTFGPDGITGHPDHRAVSQWTTAAWSRAVEPSELLYATIRCRFPMPACESTRSRRVALGRVNGNGLSGSESSETRSMKPAPGMWAFA